MKLSDYLVSSPCIAVCKLDAMEICTGCGRHIREIRGWPELSREQKLDVVARAQERMASGKMDQS
ncbi:MAG: hypothetical protein B0D91_11805 [Oceanospirillales bacterium LUC14_002_19_P2]|nr:MAG: hypothetical protein B0D91_11805 [Oceanospirillales bacterium LUC14_002_19_P2]